MDKKLKRHLKLEALHGSELVDGVARLCAMNLILRGIGPTAGEKADPPIVVDDSLRADPGERYDVILTNPLFCKKSSVRMVNEGGVEERPAAHSRARRLLSDGEQQATRFRSACQNAAQDQRPRGGCRA